MIDMIDMVDNLIKKWEKRLEFEMQILCSMERIASRESIKDQQYEVEMIKSFIGDLYAIKENIKKDEEAINILFIESEK